jgi:4-amino-4-deoxy-L-arabinose transferase-like glycosyltransferase
VIAAMTPLAALALLAAGRRFFSPSAGIVAAVVYVSIPWIVQVSAAGLVEGALAYYLLLAVYAVMLWNERQEEPGRFSRLALAGYLAGGAAAIKYPAVLFVVTPLAVCIVFREIARPALRAGYCLRSASASLGVFLLAVVLGCGLWYGKNAVLAGNPTYPLFYGVFGGQSWTPAKDAQWNRVHRPHDFSPAALAADLGKVGWRSEWLSPLPVPLAALAFLDWRRRRRLMLWLLAYFGFVIASWWLLTHRIDRFWLPAAVVLSLLAGAGGCWCGERWWRRVFLVLLCLGLGANFLTADTLVYSRYFVPLARLRHDRERVSEPHLYLNSGISGGRVLAVGDAEVFDIEVPVLYNTCFDTCLFEEIVRGRTPESIREELARRGITHVYVHWGEIDRYRRTYGFTDFVDRGVFRGLVAQGILEPVRLFARPDAREPSAVVYRVRRP